MWILLLLACPGVDWLLHPEVPDDTGDTDPSPPIDTVPIDTGGDTADALARQMYEELYDPGVVQEIRIELSADAVQTLTGAPFEYVRGNVTINGEAFLEVGIRLKGNSSYRDFRGKPALKVKLDEYTPQHYGKQDRLTLNNMVGDASMAREIVAYQLWRTAGLPGSRANYARVWINGEYYGLYANVEPVDGDFLRNHFAEAQRGGDLWEGETSADFRASGIDYFDLKSGAGDRDRIVRASEVFLRDTGDWFAAATEVIEPGQFLRFWAWSLALGNDDGYPYRLNDYFIYAYPDDPRFRFMPWGMDESWEETVAWDVVQGTAGARCLEDEPCVAALRAEVREALDAYEGANPLALVNAAFDLSAAAVAEDTRKPFTDAEVAEARATLEQRVAAWPTTLRGTMGI